MSNLHMFLTINILCLLLLSRLTGNCVSALAKIGTGKKRGTAMVPFRDVALTHYLKDSLAGKCKTTLLANVSPHKFNLVETINTLRFASRCKLIKTKAKKNVSRPKI